MPAQCFPRLFQRRVACCRLRRGKADIEVLKEKYSYGVPPLRYRQETAEVAEDPLMPILRQRAQGIHPRSTLEVEQVAVVAGGEHAQRQVQQHLELEQQERSQEQEQAQQSEADEAADDELLQLSKEVEEALVDPSKELPLSVPLPAHLLAAARKAARTGKRASRMMPDPAAEVAPQRSGSYLAALIGASNGCSLPSSLEAAKARQSLMFS